MKTKQLLTKGLSTALFAAAMLLGTSQVFAQVGGGQGGGTSIDAASMIHFKGTTAGTEFKSSKANAGLTIKDGTEGAGKVLTSDAGGNATWQTQGVGCGSFQAKRNAAQTVPINNVNTDPNTTLISDTEIYDPSNSYDPATGIYTVPSTGFYTFKGTSGNSIGGVTTATRNSTIHIVSQSQGSLAFSVVQEQAYQNGSWNTVNSLGLLNAGDKISFVVNVVHVGGTKPATTINESSISFSGTRIDCNKN